MRRTGALIVHVPKHKPLETPSHLRECVWKLEDLRFAAGSARKKVFKPKAPETLQSGNLKVLTKYSATKSLRVAPTTCDIDSNNPSADANRYLTGNRFSCGFSSFLALGTLFYLLKSRTYRTSFPLMLRHKLDCGIHKTPRRICHAVGPQNISLDVVTPSDHRRLHGQKWEILCLRSRTLGRTGLNQGEENMSEFKGPAFQTQLSRMAERMRTETAHWLMKAIRTNVQPRKEYVRLVLAMQCECKGCHGDCCTSLNQLCNAA